MLFRSYRDRTDTYVTQVTDLTADLDKIHQKLFELSADGGGDGPESVNAALHDAVNKISWSPKGEKVYRVVFLVGDAPPHMDYQDDVKYLDTCKAAVLKDIVINTIRCGSDSQTETTWKEIASRAEGRYTSIAQSGGVQVVSTPEDARLAELSGKLMTSGVYYGSKEEREMVQASLNRAESESKKAKESMDSSALAMEADKAEFRGKMAGAAAAPSASAEMSGMGMGSHVGRADLLALYQKEGDAGLAKIKDTDWPDDMKKLSATERVDFIKRKIAERQELEKQIEDASKKRSEFLREQQKKSGSGDAGFDAVVLDMLREQGAKRGIEYK